MVVVCGCERESGNRCAVLHQHPLPPLCTCSQSDPSAQEPLAPESPLWRHPAIRVFPHVSSTTHLPNAAAQMAAMRELVLAGQPLPAEVVMDRQRGY